MNNLPTDPELPLELEPEIEEPPKPLHEYVGDLFDKIRLLWSYKRFLIRATLIGFILLVGASFLAPVKYEAAVYLMPPDMNPMSGLQLMIGMKSNIASGAGGALNDLLGMKSPGQVYIREMQSRPVEDSLIRRFDLMRVYETTKQVDTRLALEDNTLFDEDRKSGVISVKVIDTNPWRAALIANAYAEELGRLQSDLSVTAGRREREYFEDQLRLARQHLDKSSTALNAFAGKNAALEIPSQGVALVSAIGSLQGQLIAAQAELQGLLQTYTENFDRVKEARARISELQRQLVRIKGGAPNPNASAFSNGPGSARTSSAPPTIQDITGLSTEYLNLYLDVKTDEAVIDALSQQYQFARLQETRHIPDVQVLDPAQVPERKSSPRRTKFGLAGLMLGFLFGCSLILSQEWWNNAGEDNGWKAILVPAVNKLNHSWLGRRLGLSRALLQQEPAKEAAQEPVQEPEHAAHL